MKPGDILPSERELARAHGVSLMTARSALAGLERQGLVERRRGSGTFVAVPRINYNKLISTTELLAGRGFSARSRLLERAIVHDEVEIVARLGMPSEEPLVKLERLRQVAAEPLALETNYLPAARFGDLAHQPLEAGSLFTTLEKFYAVEIAYADEEVDATVASKKAAALLEVPDEAPLLRIRQVIYSSQGHAIMYVFGLYRADRHQLLIRRFR